MRRLIVCRSAAALLFVLPTASGQTPLTVEQILAKVAGKYRARQRYLLEFTGTAGSPESPRSNADISAKLAVQHPDKLRMEGNIR